MRSARNLTNHVAKSLPRDRRIQTAYTLNREEPLKLTEHEISELGNPTCMV